MAERMKQVTGITGDTTDENTSDEEEQPPPRRGKHLKSGIDRTGASMVLHKVAWPHEIVYTSEGKPAAYQDLSIPLFVQGYLIIMVTEEGLIQDLMSHTQLYGWERARTFHGVCLNQIEQGHFTWTDGEEKLKFCRALVWHPASSSLSAPP